MNRRPTCEDAQPREADGEGLVQIGLRTGSRSTGFEATRRDVLSLMGFSIGAIGLSGCRAPTQHAVPLPSASTEMVPGVPNMYATTCGGCAASCGLVVKQRDGRPIKIEGNEASPLTGGGTCAAGQASVLTLYDDARLRGPVWLGNPVSWPEIDHHVGTMLNRGSRDGRAVVLVSQTITSPSTLAVLDQFREAFPTFRHVVYDTMSLAALREANKQAHGAAVVPHYRFDQARVVVGLDADFLGTWLAPVEFARQWARRRTGDAQRLFHVQCESGLSVTGSNADLRLAIAPSEVGAVAVALLAAVARHVKEDGLAGLEAVAEAAPHAAAIDRVAAALVAHRGESLVVTGSDDVATQLVVAKLNALLGNVGTTVDLAAPSLQRQGDDQTMSALIDDMNAGRVRALFVWGANPVYDHPDGGAFAKALAKVQLTVSFGDRRDETGAHVQALCPDHHFLESWGDAEPVRGELSLRQPLITPLHDTRSGVESLLAWAGRPADHHAALREFWRRTLYPSAPTADPFDDFWERTLERGVIHLARPATATHPFAGDWQSAVREIVARGNRPAPADGYELALYESVGARDGRQANNPWLLELPDPITRLTWGNVACIAPSTAAALGIATGDVVALTTETGKLELPAFVQPAQDRRTISVAVGYGRWAAGKAADGLGGNVYPLARVERGLRRSSAHATIAKTGRRARLSPAQTHFSMEGRDIVQTMALGASAAAAEHEHAPPAEGGEKHEKLPDLWKERLHGAHAWGMSIDLDACTGCSACVVACQAENNVPVVGAEQVRKSRIMHWLRIDRYFEGDGDDATTVHQPMMCQHCQHAPCETVCPVLATTTSSEGINQQVYNRCIGTRYCANNCPYKVRRFNWHNFTANDDFPYNMTSPLGRLVLNPDVTVRSRGVMEKCNLCVQRIQLAKNQALLQRRPMADGDVATACQQACPTGAIVFGDLADAGSRVSKLLAGRRAYRVLEDLGTRPNVGYLKKIENKEKA